MGYIKEPDGVDFFVDPTPPTTEDLKMISEIIAHHKATGEIKTFEKTIKRRKNLSKAKAAVKTGSH